MTHIFRTLAIALFVMLSFNAFSQNVGINTDGSDKVEILLSNCLLNI